MTNRLSPARVAALIVVIVAFVALSAFALLARAYEPARPAVAGSALSLLPPRIATPIAASTEVLPSAAARPGSANAGSGVVAPSAPGAVRAPAGAVPAADQPKPLAPCELGLAVPTQQAGLANLTPIVPLFGPFSPEAFAMVPAFAPGFSLFGPLIIAGGAFLSENPALTQTAYDVVHPLQTAGFDAIAPYYTPVRPQVLEGEAAVASLLAPNVATFASLPGATCLPATLALVTPR